MTNTLKPLIDQLVQMIKEGYDFGKGELPEIAKEGSDRNNGPLMRMDNF